MSVMLRLTESEIIHGSMCGSMRHAQNKTFGRRARHRDPFSSQYMTHIEAAFGELAVARFLGRHWTGMSALGNIEACDVSGGIEVRTSIHDGAHLIVHSYDHDDAPIVLVTGAAPCLTLRGWILGRDAKREEFLRDRDYWVPQDSLDPIVTLRSWLGR